jgi:hypothetical protein
MQLIMKIGTKLNKIQVFFHKLFAFKRNLFLCDFDFHLKNYYFLAKTIVVEKNKKIIGFLCNIENCHEFYKSISGLQSHMDRVHRNRQSNCDKTPKMPTFETAIETNLSPIKTCAKKSTQSSVRKPNAKKVQNIAKTSVSKTTQSLAKKRVLKPRDSSAQKSVLNPNKKFLCRFRNCTFGAENSESLAEHYSQTHKNLMRLKMKFNCDRPQCEASFGTKYQLITHRINKHKNGRRFKCKITDCKLSFKSKFDVIQHLRMHSIKKSAKRNLNEDNVRKQSNNCQNVTQFKCKFPKCKTSFKTRFALNQHLKKLNHSDVKRTPNEDKTVSKTKFNQTLNRFKCKLSNCDRSFQSKVQLNQHLKSFNHTKERPFKCDYPNCERSFARTTGLSLHTHRKHGLKPFKCPVFECQLRFETRFARKNHFSTHQKH